MSDPLDILTLAEAKSVLHVGTNDVAQDDAIARVVTTVSRDVDTFAGPVVVRSITGERHDGGRYAVELRFGPVSSVSSITEYQGTTAVALVEETAGTRPQEGWLGEQYRPDPALYSGIVYRRQSGYDRCFWPMRGSVVATYSAGRSASTEAVDARFKEAAAIALRNYWRTYESTILSDVDGEYDMPAHAFPSMGLPKAAKWLLMDFAQPYTGFG